MLLKFTQSDKLCAKPSLLSIKNSSTNNPKEESKNYFYPTIDHYSLLIWEEWNQNTQVEEVLEERNKNLIVNLLTF